MNTSKGILFRILLLALFVVLLYPYLEVLVQYLQGEHPEKFLLTPLDLFFGRDHLMKNETITSYLERPFIYKNVLHPFMHPQALLNYSMLTLACIGTWRLFKSNYQRKTILMFTLSVIAWFGVVSIIYVLGRYFWLSDHLINARQNRVFPLRIVCIEFLRMLLGFILVMMLKTEDLNHHAAAGTRTLPLKWMRAFGVMADRSIVLFPGILAVVSYIEYFYQSRWFEGFKGFNAESFDEKLRDWFIVSTGIALFVAYLISESISRTSPFKILTGTEVRKATDGKPAGFGNILVRTLCRFIPLDLFSFLARIGWHDAISKTKLDYIQEESWLARHARIGKWMGAVSIILFLWIICHSLFLILTEGDFLWYRTETGDIDILVSTCFLVLFLFAAISIWLTAVSNYVYNIGTEETESNLFILKGIGIWIPVINFIALYELMGTTSNHMEVHYPDSRHIRGFKRRSTAFRVWFLIFYYLFSWWFYILFTNRGLDFPVGNIVFFFGFTICMIAFVRYASQAYKIAMEGHDKRSPA